MKKLEIVDTFECSVHDFWKHWRSPELLAAVEREVGFKAVQILASEETAERATLRRRITPPGEVPPHIKQALNNSLNMLRQAMGMMNVQTLPEMFRRLIGWADVAFQDHLHPKDGQKPEITMTYVEELIFDKKKKQQRWSITPELFKDFKAFKGTLRVEPSEKGCRRTILGEIDLGIPGVGDMVEAYMVQEIGKVFKKGGEELQKRLKEPTAEGTGTTSTLEPDAETLAAEEIQATGAVQADAQAAALAQGLSPSPATPLPQPLMHTGAPTPLSPFQPAPLPQPGSPFQPMPFSPFQSAAFGEAAMAVSPATPLGQLSSATPLGAPLTASSPAAPLSQPLSPFHTTATQQGTGTPTASSSQPAADVSAEGASPAAPSTTSPTSSRPGSSRR